MSKHTAVIWAYRQGRRVKIEEPIGTYMLPGRQKPAYRIRDQYVPGQLEAIMVTPAGKEQFTRRMIRIALMRHDYERMAKQ